MLKLGITLTTASLAVQANGGWKVVQRWVLTDTSIFAQAGIWLMGYGDVEAFVEQLDAIATRAIGMNEFICMKQ